MSGGVRGASGGVPMPNRLVMRWAARRVWPGGGRYRLLTVAGTTTSVFEDFAARLEACDIEVRPLPQHSPPALPQQSLACSPAQVSARPPAKPLARSPVRPPAQPTTKNESLISPA